MTKSEIKRKSALKSEGMKAFLILSLFSFSAFSCASTGVLGAKRNYTVYTAQKRGGAHEISVEYPVFPSQSAVNTRIRELIKADYDKFMSFSGEDYVPTHTLYTVRIAAVERSSLYIQAVLSFYTFTGGANGVNYSRSVNYNTKTKSLVSLSDIIDMEKVYDKCALFFKIGADEVKKVFQDEENFSFVISGKKVTVFFKQNLLTPHSEGVPSVDFEL